MPTPQKRTHKRATSSAPKTPRSRKRNARTSPRLITRSEFSWRLIEAMETLNCSSSELSRKIGGKWTTTRVSDYLNSERSPNADALIKICTALGLSADWLLYGQGGMLRGQDRTPKDLGADFCTMLRREIAARLQTIDPRIADPSYITVDYREVVAALVEHHVSVIQSLITRVSTGNERAVRIFRAANVLEAIAQQRTLSIHPEAADDLWRDLLKDAEFIETEHSIENAYKGADSRGDRYVVGLNPRAISILRDVVARPPLATVRPEVPESLIRKDR